MMLQQVETGYKPEFALGALYAGENAAANQQSQDEELIRQFLANQRESKMQPLDFNIKGLESAKAQALNTPGLLNKFAQSTEAGYDDSIRKNEIGNIMQPFLREKAPEEGRKAVIDANLMKQVAEYDSKMASGISDNGLPMTPELRDDLMQQRTDLVSRMGSTPELYGKLQQENTKGEYSLEHQRIANAGHLAAAQASANKAHQSEIVKSLGPMVSLAKNYDTQLTKLETAEMNNDVINNLLGGRQKPSDPKAAAAWTADYNAAKGKYKAQLQAESAQVKSMIKYMMSQVPGMQGMPTEQPSAARPEPIKLK